MDIYLEFGQRRQIGGVKGVKGSSVYFSGPVTSQQFVVEINGHLELEWLYDVVPLNSH